MVIPILNIHKSKKIVANIPNKHFNVAVQYKKKNEKDKKRKKEMDIWTFLRYYFKYNLPLV